MGQYFTLQKLVTKTGDSTGTFSETQSMDEFADVSGWDVAFITLHTMTVSAQAGDNVEIGIGTVDTKRKDGLDTVPDGPAGVCVAFSSLTSNQWYKAFIGPGNEPQGTGTYPIENLLGWNLTVYPTGGGGAFSVTFEIFVTLKRAS